MVLEKVLIHFMIIQDDVDKLKERAKRFGQVLSSSLSKVDEDERIKKRKERFGDVTAATNNKPAKFAKVTYNSPDDVSYINYPYKEAF